MRFRFSFFGGLMTAIVLFVGFLLGILIFAMLQPQNLVSKNYYNEELAYQQHIDKVQRLKGLQNEPRFIYRKNGQLSVQFPFEWLEQSISGTLVLFRPSDSRLDRTLDLNIGKDGLQLIDVIGLQPGLWKIKLDWQMDGTSYYTESSLVIG
ncbi:MAG: hypothetical protein GXO91_07240 [FCB group bacterium]|nr:hypothetical protein [FCB group bacterium]